MGARGKQPIDIEVFIQSHGIGIDRQKDEIGVDRRRASGASDDIAKPVFRLDVVGRTVPIEPDRRARAKRGQQNHNNDAPAEHNLEGSGKHAHRLVAGQCVLSQLLGHMPC